MSDNPAFPQRIDEVSIAVLLGPLKSKLSPLGLQTAAMLLLAYIAKQAETAPNPAHGGSVIDHIAGCAKEFYRREENAQ